MEDIRLEKEEILKTKLGDENINLENVSDEDLDKVVTEEDIDETIKNKTGVENLNVEELSPEEKEKLLGSLKSGGLEASLVETESKEKILNSLGSLGFKESEAEEIYNDSLAEKKISHRLYL